MATTYSVILSLSTTGSLSAKLGDMAGKASDVEGRLGKVRDGASRIGEAIESASSKMGSMLGAVVDKALSVAETFAKVGVAAGLGLATYGVVKLNNELEQTNISLGAIFAAQGFAKDFEGGMRKATDQVAKMKQDVKSLPGDLGQLANIMKTIATPAAQGGAGPDEIRKLAGRTMLVGTILGVAPEVSSREMANLLSGRAGAHNILGTRLGLVGTAAKQFNALGPEERLAKINTELGKYSGAADRFGQSFVAQWTTLKDNIKYGFAAPVTGPLFEHVKRTLVDLNDWFDQNKGKVEYFTYRVGTNLAAAWDSVVRAAKRLEPVLEKIAAHLENFKLSDLGTMLGHAGAGILAAKVLPGAISAGGSLIGRTVGALGASGAGAGAAGMGVVGGAVTAAAIVGLAEAALAAGGELSALADTTSVYHQRAVEAASKLGDALDTLKDRLSITIIPSLEHFGVAFTEHLASMISGFNDLMGPMDGVKNALDTMIPSFATFMETLTGKKPSELVFGPKLGPTETPDYPERPYDVGDYFRSAALAANRAAASQDRQQPRPAPVTNIQKVEIVVKGNDDPTRTARLTLLEIQRFARNPKSSKYVANYAGTP